MTPDLSGVCSKCLVDYVVLKEACTGFYVFGGNIALDC